MASLQEIKTRLKAVKNVGQITKAMEVVSATKMRRAQETALNSRPYAFEALKLLRRLSLVVGGYLPLSEVREIKNTLVVVIASDKGLAGSFNAQIFKTADSFFANDALRDQPKHHYSLVVVGKKAIAYGAKKKYPIVNQQTDFGDITKPEEVDELVSFLVAGYQENKWDRVVTISTHFRTALKQEALTRQILPIDPERILETVQAIVPEEGRYSGVGKGGEENNNEFLEYIFEPSAGEVLSALVPHLVEMQVYHLFLEAKASEHSARRVAMKTASDNATELSDELTLSYNKVRQVGITNELMEITGTMATLE